MNAGYSLCPLFAVRLCGAPFDVLERLATPLATRRACRVSEAEKLARKLGKELIQSLPTVDVRGKPRKAAVERIVRQLRTVEGIEVSPALESYERARGALLNERDALLQTLTRELEAARRELRKQAAAWLPAFSVFAAEITDETLFDEARLNGPLPVLNSKKRKRERTWLLYLQRIAAKNDTMSAFGPTSWGWLDPKVKGIQLAPVPGISRRDIYSEKWVTEALATAINADPGARPEIAPRPNPRGWLDGNMFIMADTGEEIPLDPEDAEYVRKADGSTPAREIGSLERIKGLVARGVLEWRLALVELVAHRLVRLRADVEAWSEGPVRRRWLAEIDAFRDMEREFERTSEPTKRRALMRSAKERACALGGQVGGARGTLYRGANAIGEDCARDSGLRLGPNVTQVLTQDAAPWIDFWRDAYTYLASEAAAGLRRLLEQTPRVRGRTRLPTFLRHCESRGFNLVGDGLLRLADPAVAAVRDVFCEALAGRPEAPEWTLTREECHCLRTQLGVQAFHEFTYPAADFLIRADSLAAIERGDFEVILGELHGPMVMMQHGMSWACPDREVFAERLRKSMGTFSVLHYGYWRVSRTAHTTIDFHRQLPTGRFRLVSLYRGEPSWSTIPASEVEVFVDENTGDVRMRSISTGELLGSFSRDWIVWIAFHPFRFSRRPHFPRLRVGRCIVQRRIWTIKSSELEEGRFDGVDMRLLTAVERLRSQRGLPRWIFIKPAHGVLSPADRTKDRKAVLVDLESYLSMDILAAWLRKYPEIEATEMLPEPERLVWREDSGKYLFEIRALLQPADG